MSSRKYRHIVLEGTNYKKLKSYQFFFEGNVKRLETKTHGNRTYVKASVSPSKKTRYRVVIEFTPQCDVLLASSSFSLFHNFKSHCSEESTSQETKIKKKKEKKLYIYISNTNEDKTHCKDHLNYIYIYQTQMKIRHIVKTTYIVGRNIGGLYNVSYLHLCLIYCFMRKTSTHIGCL